MAGRRIAAALMALGFVGGAAGTAGAQDGFVWQYDRYLDADPFQTRLNLTYGIPETDAIQVHAQCQIGAGGTYATVEVGANVGSLQEGATIDVEFVGSGFHHVVTGDVVGRNREVGITGASLALQLDDPLWQAIIGLSELHYNVVGFTAQRLSLRGSSDPTQQFLRDCREMPEPDETGASSQGAAGGAPSPTPSSANTVSCSAFGSLRSVDGGASTSVTFINRADGFRSVMWLDHNGTPQPYNNLNPGDAYTQQTFVGHPWMITDGPGNCLEIYMPPAGGSVFEISAPNQSFGAE